MKSLIILAAIFAASSVFAEARKPASLDTDIMNSYLKTADLLSVARSENRVCEHDAYQSEIIGMLRRVRYSNGFSPSMITPAMKSALAGTIALKEIMSEVNLDNNPNTSTFEKALTGATFESMAAGAYGPGEVLDMKAGGVLEMTRLEVLNEEPWSRHVKVAGKWGVKNDKGVTRVWYTIGKKTKTYRLERTYETHDNGWVLKTKARPKDADDSRIIFFNGIVSECEA